MESSGYTPHSCLARLTPDPMYSKTEQINLFGVTHLSERMLEWHPTNVALYLWAKTGLPNYLLTALGDRMEMAHSVEGMISQRLTDLT